MSSSFDNAVLNQTTTRIGRNASLEGELGFTSSMRIEGHFKGKIRAEGFLFITEDAEVEAEIEGVDIVVAGKLRGNIVASGKVELLETARVHGNIRADRVRLLDGVVFEGRCEMIRRSESIDIFALPLEELRANIGGQT